MRIRIQLFTLMLVEIHHNRSRLVSLNHNQSFNHIVLTTRPRRNLWSTAWKSLSPAGKGERYPLYQCCGSGIRCLFDPWIRDEQPGSYFLELKIPKFFDADPGSGMEQLGSGIRDGKMSDPGSGINIPDPQHCIVCTFKS
jgi:hypothetical protein